MPVYSYRAFGLAIEADVPIAGLPTAPAAPPDLRIHLGTVPPGWDEDRTPLRQLWRSESTEHSDADDVTVSTTEDGAYLALRYADGTRFVIARAGDAIWGTWRAPMTQDEAATYLLGPVIGFTLRLRGVTCLHASVLVSEGRAVAVTGPAGMGKSTVAARYALRGGRVVADDIAVLHPEGTAWWVQPSIPGVRLWDDSVEMLLGRADALPLLAVGWEKRHLDLQTSTAGYRADELIPLGAVYVLHSPEGPGDPAAPVRLGSREALMALVSNTYANVLLDGPMRRAEFAAVTALARTVPVWRVHAPEDAGQLDRLCEAIAAAGRRPDFHPGDA